MTKTSKELKKMLLAINDRLDIVEELLSDAEDIIYEAQNYVGKIDSLLDEKSGKKGKVEQNDRTKIKRR